MRDGTRRTYCCADKNRDNPRLLPVLLVGMVASSSTIVYLTPRVFTSTDGGIYSFDSETGASQTTFVLILGNDVRFALSDITVFGDGEVTSMSPSGGGAAVFIEVEVVVGGTIQIEVSGDKAAGSL